MPQAKSEKSMSFFDHFDELRERLTRILWVFVAGFMGCYFLAAEWVLEFLRAPLFEIMPPDQQKLYFTSLFENFLTHLKISAVTAIFILCPYVFYEIWGFIAPGLYEREKKYALPFILGGSTFFIGGAAFAYYGLFPIAFQFFVTFGAESDTPLLTIDAYYTTCLKLLLLFGLAFNLPVIVSFLGFLGIFDADLLRTHRRTAILIITIACAMFAPPDAISMILLMIPLILFYEGSILVVQWLGVKRREDQMEAAREARNP